MERGCCDLSGGSSDLERGFSSGKMKRVGEENFTFNHPERATCHFRIDNFIGSSC